MEISWECAVKKITSTEQAANKVLQENYGHSLGLDNSFWKISSAIIDVYELENIFVHTSLYQRKHQGNATNIQRSTDKKEALIQIHAAYKTKWIGQD